jgi:putative transposase
MASGGLPVRRHLAGAGTGAALVMPVVSIEAMNQHLAEISTCVSLSAIALRILDGAGWHGSPRLAVPENIVLLPLPPYAPELNSTENIWEYLRGNWLSHCVWDSYEAILDACCDAWNPLMPNPGSSPPSEPKRGHRLIFRAVGIRRISTRNT